MLFRYIHFITDLQTCLYYNFPRYIFIRSNYQLIKSWFGFIRTWLAEQHQPIFCHKEVCYGQSQFKISYVIYYSTNRIRKQRYGLVSTTTSLLNLPTLLTNTMNRVWDEQFIFQHISYKRNNHTLAHCHSFANTRQTYIYAHVKSLANVKSTASQLCHIAEKRTKGCFVHAYNKLDRPMRRRSPYMG